MRRLALLILITLASAGTTRADIECVKTQCEAKGRTCVETLYARYDTCTKTARKKCDALPVAEKFNCLRAELSPCARTRNSEQDACLEGVRSCYKTCGPLKGKRADYWCVASIGNETTAAFCPTDQNSKVTEQCAKVFSRQAPHTVSMTCDPLY